MSGIDIDGDGTKDDITGPNGQPDGVSDQRDVAYWKSLDKAQKVQIRAIYDIQNNGGVATADDPSINVPDWLYGTDKTSEVYSTLVNLPFTLVANNDAKSKKKYDRISKFLFGAPGASLQDVSTAWYNATKLAGNTGIDLAKIVNNPQFKEFIFANTTKEAPNVPSNSYSLTKRSDADTAITQTMQQYLDRLPTKAEREQFFKQLRNAQMKNPTVTRAAGNNTYTTSGGVTAAEFATKYILKKLSGGNKDLEGALGGVQDTLRATAVKNGLTISNAELVKAVKEAVKSGDVSGYVNNFQTTSAQKAAKRYTALAPDWADDPNATVLDLSSDYVSEMARILELDPNDITVQDIEPAIAAIGQDGQQRKLAAWEWRKQLRGDARYQYTGQAKQEATGMAQSFARAFGVNV